MPSREIAWNIPHEWLVYVDVLAIIALSIVGYSIYRRYKLWHLGKGSDRPKDTGK